MMRRRQFLLGGAVLGAGAAADRLLTDTTTASAESSAPAPLARRVAFEGRHQAGVIDARPPQAVFAAFDAVTDSRAELAAAVRALSERARALTSGYRALIGAP